MQIFLSYASKQRGIAERLQIALEHTGHRVFFDRLDLVPGNEYDQRITEELSKADLLIFLISRKSIKRHSYAKSELEIYKSRVRDPHGRVLPVKVQKTWWWQAIPPYLKAVDILDPPGDIVPEVLFHVHYLSEARAEHGPEALAYSHESLNGVRPREGLEKTVRGPERTKKDRPFGWLAALVIALGLIAWLLKAVVARSNSEPSDAERVEQEEQLVQVPYPQVQVVAAYQGDVFHDVPEAERENLKNEIRGRVKKAMETIAPCMEWVVAEQGQKWASGVPAQLHVDLSEKGHSLFLSFSGVIGAGAPNLIREVDTEVSPSPWRPRDHVAWAIQKQQIFNAITLLFVDARQELRKDLDSEFIADIPIANSIAVDPGAQRIIVPLDAKRLNLEPGSLLKLLLKAPLCAPKDGEYMIGLRSDGDFQDKLRCHNWPIAECPSVKWESDLAQQLRKRVNGSVKVFLSKDHRHCTYGPEYCPGRDEPYGRLR